MSLLDDYAARPIRMKEVEDLANGSPVPDDRIARSLFVGTKAPEPAQLGYDSEEAISYADKRAQLRKSILKNGLGANPTEEELACLDPDVETQEEWNTALKVDYKALYQLARIGSTPEEIRAMLGIPTWMLENRLKVVMEAAKAQGRVALRKAQFRNALAGDSKMQVWLGREYLGQGQLASGDSEKLSTDIAQTCELAFASIIQDVEVKVEEEAVVRPTEMIPAVRLTHANVPNGPQGTDQGEEGYQQRSPIRADPDEDDEPYVPEIRWQ